jgi:hypothetical protein
MHLVKLATALGIVAGVVWTAPAAAQKVDGAVHLALSTEFVSYTKLDYTLETDFPAGDYDGKTSTTRWGFADDNGAMIEVGYGLSEMFVLGGFLQLGGQTVTEEAEPLNEEFDTDTFAVAVGPKLDILFLEDSKVRPYVTVMLGVGHASTDTEASNTKNSSTQFLVQAGGGIRWFAAPGFSLDPGLMLGLATGSGEYEPDLVGVDHWDTSGTALHVGLSLALSGWIL